MAADQQVGKAVEAGHRVEIEFDGGVMTAKLICPTSGCSEREGHCDARDWFDNVAPEETLVGKVTVPARVEWQGDEDGPLFHLAAIQPCLTQPGSVSGFTRDDADRLGEIAGELEHLPAEIRRHFDQDGRDARFLHLKQKQILDSIDGTPVSDIRQQATQQERERVELALKELINTEVERGFAHTAGSLARTRHALRAKGIEAALTTLNEETH